MPSTLVTDIGELTTNVDRDGDALGTLEPLGERRGGRAQLAVAQALAGDGHGRLRLPLVERRQQRSGHARLLPRLADA